MPKHFIFDKLADKKLFDNSPSGFKIRFQPYSDALSGACVGRRCGFYLTAASNQVWLLYMTLRFMSVLIKKTGREG